MTQWFKVDDELCSVHFLTNMTVYVFYDMKGNLVTVKGELYE